jgi:tetratricopeptide (TPR) repeat protein
VASADSSEEARQHYQRGTAHYALGEYADAAAEYQEAFRLKQDPALLYNAAQAYRSPAISRKRSCSTRATLLCFQTSRTWKT